MDDDIRYHVPRQRSYPTLDPAATHREWECKECGQEWPCPARQEYEEIANGEAEAE